MKWIAVIIFVIMMTTGILILNDISMHEIYYAVGIDLFVMVLVLAFACYIIKLTLFFVCLAAIA